MNFFVVEKNRLIPLRQYEAKLNRLSFIQRLFNTIDYWLNMKIAEFKIHKALKKGLPVCFLECDGTNLNKARDVIARLRYLGYDIDDIYIPYGTDSTARFRVRLVNSKEGIDYVSC